MDRGLNETDAKRAFARLTPEDGLRIAGQVDNIRRYRNLTEGRCLAVIAALGMFMAKDPELDWEEAFHK